MDPLERADALLSRAQARGAFVVTPDNAESPMDASSTLQIERAVVRAVDPDATGRVAAEEIRQHDATAHHHLAERAPTSELPGVEVEVEEMDGLIPTTTQRMKTSLASRLDTPPEAVTEPDFETEDVGGLIPTTTQRMKSSFTSRLDG